MKQFKMRLEKILKEQKMSIASFSVKSGINTSTIYKWLRGKSSPRANQLITICKTLNIRANYLLGLDNIKHKSENKK